MMALSSLRLRRKDLLSSRSRDFYIKLFFFSNFKYRDGWVFWFLSWHQNGGWVANYLLDCVCNTKCTALLNVES